MIKVYQKNICFHPKSNSNLVKSMSSTENDHLFFHFEVSFLFLTGKHIILTIEPRGSGVNGGDKIVSFVYSYIAPETIEYGHQIAPSHHLPRFAEVPISISDSKLIAEGNERQKEEAEQWQRRL